MTAILWYFFRAFGFGSQPPTSSEPVAVVRFPVRDNVARLRARGNVAVFPSRGAE